ncbi:Serine aminopeptidase, S33 [Thermoanaerobacter uzonensis DSM 18761]|jgi:alpha-beta hydrolase superfamily lysophospholipase|uniref:Serine aminopeptidase, S33 n=1 Tax=Thermoanaerobacter uzonensis DSM 18761 TaxID=1123369 RepID=A0A1M4TH54_9THEO|nr:alpha/beta hydrolase [Thermoanaerobacter uzonensis]SHE43839.1 Serine aminopeptidase, S33 [Thermoanaerobacter uzonensis DSM 18761]
MGKIYILICRNQKLVPIGIIQVFHGMAEHGGRYQNFARYMNEKGFYMD